MNGSFKSLKNLSPSKTIFLIILIIDFLLYVCSTQGYYVSFLKPTGVIFPALLTFIGFGIFARGLKNKILWVVLVTALALPLLALFWFINALFDNSYATIQSPTKNLSLVIEYRDFTLGETTHSYNFYRKTPFPGLMVKLNKKPVDIVTRGTDAPDLVVLGINNAKWSNGNYVIFSSPYSETKVEFKKKTPKLNHGKSKKNKFVPLGTDVTLLGEKVQNTEAMDKFITDSKSGKESEVRFVILRNAKDPVAVYMLKSRKDSNAGQSWIEITRDRRYDSKEYNLIEPQQCSSVSKDTKRGAYYLNECFHTWEIKLMPINDMPH